MTKENLLFFMYILLWVLIIFTTVLPIINGIRLFYLDTDPACYSNKEDIGNIFYDSGFTNICKLAGGVLFSVGYYTSIGVFMGIIFTFFYLRYKNMKKAIQNDR